VVPGSRNLVLPRARNALLQDLLIRRTCRATTTNAGGLNIRRSRAHPCRSVFALTLPIGHDACAHSRLAIGVLSLALGLSACGGGSSTNVTSPGSTSAPTTTTATFVCAPTRQDCTSEQVLATVEQIYEDSRTDGGTGGVPGSHLRHWESRTAASLRPVFRCPDA
jgi:hypothetical protein